MEALEGLGQLKIVDDDEERHGLEEAIQNNEFYFKNWIPASIDLSTLDHIAVEIALEGFVKTRSKLGNEISLPRSAEDVEAFVFTYDNCFKVPGLKLVQAFLAVNQLDGDCWAKNATADVDAGIGIVKKFVASGNMDEDYLAGVAYLGRWIRLQILLKEGKLPLGEEYKAEEEYESLPNKGKAIVLATKAFFLRIINRKGEDDVDILKVDTIRQVVEYDPKNYFWHFLLGNWLRRQREDYGRTSWYITLDDRLGPSEEELQIIWETCELTDYPQTQDEDPTKPSNIRALVLAELCKVLAQVVRSRPRYPVKTGNLVFPSASELVAFVKDTIRNLLSDKDSRTYSVLVRSADILANILPYRCKQFDDAEKYYKEALTMGHCESSKVHHKLGLLYVISTKHNDLEKAIVHLREAVKLNNFNFPGTMDLINTLLSEPEKNRAELEELFGSREKSSLSAVHYSQFRFAEGAFRFMLGDREQAVKIWIEANKAFPSNDVFHGLGKTAKRHYWTTLIEFKDARQSLFDYFLKFGEDLEDEERKLLNKLLDHVHVMKERQPQVQENWKRERYVSEADADGDWRRSGPISATSTNVPPQKVGHHYVPPGRRNGQAEFSNNYNKHRTPEHSRHRGYGPSRYSRKSSLSDGVDDDIHARED